LIFRFKQKKSGQLNKYKNYIGENTDDLEFDINEDDKIDEEELEEKIRKLKEEIEEE